MDRMSRRPRSVSVLPRTSGGRRLLIVGLVLLAVAGVAIGAAAGHVLNGRPSADAMPSTLPAPAVVDALPAPGIDAVAGTEPCENADVVAALDANDADGVLAAFGGADVFRAHVAAGSAPCVRLDDGSRPWLVVNKQRTIDPVGFRPESLEAPESAAAPDLALVPEAAAALDRLVAAAAEAGAGEMAMTSGFRSYDYQETLFASYARQHGTEAAETFSARPGHSEHQTGLAADLVACDPGCGTLGQFGSTDQGRWTAENAWRFGWIVRYEEGRADITGYAPEPWHLRYVGEELAAAYRDGGFHTLEEFFGLPAAPTYEATASQAQGADR